MKENNTSLYLLIVVLIPIILIASFLVYGAIKNHKPERNTITFKDPIHDVTDSIKQMLLYVKPGSDNQLHKYCFGDANNNFRINGMVVFNLKVGLDLGRLESLTTFKKF